MNTELLASQTVEKGVRFDPRTKLAVLLTLVLLILGGSYQTTLCYLPALLPLVMLFSAQRYKAAGLYAALFGVCLCLQAFALPRVNGVLGYLLMLPAVMPLYFLPSIMAAYFIVTTTTVSEFVAAMERVHIPEQITIPMAVMFRFFPTVMEEWRAINDAMRMRGIRWAGGKIGAMLEYRLVPMLLCSVNIGDELSAAALTRGLGGPVHRTNICELGFRLQDIVLLLLCLAGLVVQAVLWLGVAL